MITVTFYFQVVSDKCIQVRLLLDKLVNEIPFKLVEINIDSDPLLLKELENDVPVVEIGPYRLNYPFSEDDLKIALNAAKDRQDHLDKINPQNINNVKKIQKITLLDKISFWFTKHYLAFINTILGVFIGFTFLAPILMKLGEIKTARVIYFVYSPLCHQFAFRSWFLFGEQAFYPRALANIPGYKTYEQISGSSDQVDILAARAFIGNDFVGYKVAICQRDIAEYMALLLFGVLFALSGRRFKPLKWYVWIILGIIPIGVDGASQIPGLAENYFPSWMIIRESTPLLRSITGAMFGFLTAWFMIPLIDEAMKETQILLVKKFATIRGKF